jgi:hypothetical protein
MGVNSEQETREAEAERGLPSRDEDRWQAGEAEEEDGQPEVEIA